MQFDRLEKGKKELQFEFDNTEPLRRRCQQLEDEIKYLNTQQADKIVDLTMSLNTLTIEKKKLQSELDNLKQKRTQSCVENVTLKGQLKSKILC